MNVPYAWKLMNQELIGMGIMPKMDIVANKEQKC